ncbi:MAG: methyltransferase domain-containing protein [Planctomycetota bacterium]
MIGGGSVIAEKSLRDAVRRAYSAAAERPTVKHAFPVGRPFAESLGYPADLLDTIPPIAYEAFSGVSCVSLFSEIPFGSRLLDLGCGAGLDSIIAAKRVGPGGSVTGVDFSEEMLERSQKAAGQSAIDNVHFQRADAESLPFDDATFDVALVNGIFNLNPKREAIFRELARVVKPGGAVWAAELILSEPLSAEVLVDETQWFA